jgi:hypothetical protein
MAEEDLDPGDALVTQVATYLGGLDRDEQVVVYGLGHAYIPYGSGTTLPRGTAEWIGAVLGEFRTAPCRFCHRGLEGHCLELTDEGPYIACTFDGSRRPVWTWTARPVQQPVWRLLVAVTLWVGIPLASLGLASWLMPTVAALSRRDGAWGAAAAAWGMLTLLEVLVIDSDNVLVGLLALTVWLGSAVYGGLQVRRWTEGLRPVV